MKQLSKKISILINNFYTTSVKINDCNAICDFYNNKTIDLKLKKEIIITIALSASLYNQGHIMNWLHDELHLMENTTEKIVREILYVHKIQLQIQTLQNELDCLDTYKLYLNYVQKNS